MDSEKYKRKSKGSIANSSRTFRNIARSIGQQAFAFNKYENTGDTGHKKHVMIDESNVSFGQLVHQNASELSHKIRRVLHNRASATTASINPILREGDERKGRFMISERARNEAQICEIIQDIEGDGKNYENEMTCCWSKKAKKQMEYKKLLKEIDAENRLNENETDERYTKTFMSHLQQLAKWAVIVIAVSDFVLCLQDVYRILLEEMQVTYLFLVNIYNCDGLIGNGDYFVMIANVIHSFFSLCLLFVENEDTSKLFLYWIGSQIFMSAVVIVEAFFVSRFRKHSTAVFFEYTIWRIPLDLIQICIVMLRYYKLSNPFPDRIKNLAADIRMDRSLNTELKLKSSLFLQSKFRLREVAAYQTLEVLRKIEERAQGARLHTRESLILQEIDRVYQNFVESKEVRGIPRRETIHQPNILQSKRVQKHGFQSKAIFHNEREITKIHKNDHTLRA